MEMSGTSQPQPQSETTIRTLAPILLGVLLLVTLVVLSSDVTSTRGRTRRISPKNQCINNLKLIDMAVQQWKIASNVGDDSTYSLAARNILHFAKDQTLPVCPSGGQYSPGTNVSDSPKCSIPGHTL